MGNSAGQVSKKYTQKIWTYYIGDDESLRDYVFTIISQHQPNYLFIKCSTRSVSL